METTSAGNATKRKFPGEDSNSSEKKRRTAFYLADYTPIRTIEVSNLPDDVCSAYIRGYFENTGPVENVVIERKVKDNKLELVAYVTFVLPEDAGKLICEKTESSFRFTIKEAAEMYQPKVDPKILKLEDVIDDCLLHIMSYLDLIDVVNLGKTSIRMQSVTKQLYEKKYHFSFGANTGDSSINETNLPVILEVVGEYISSIEWHGLNPTALDLLAKYCPNVTVMKVCSPANALNSNHLKIHKDTFFKQVKRLHIENSHLYDVGLKKMIPASTIESLILDGCRHIRGKFLPKRKTPKLEHLTIINCSGLDYPPDNWTAVKDFQWKNALSTFAVDRCCSYIDCLTSPPEILAKFKVLQLDFSCFVPTNLQNLNFSGLTQLTEFTVTRKQSYFPSYFQNVEPFANFNYVLTAMTNISTLESFSIENIQINDDTVKTLGLMKNLKKLKLNNVQNTIGKRLYTTLPKELQNLTELSMSMEVPELNNKWISEMIAALPNLHYFSHSSTTWLLLSMILLDRLTRKRSILHVGIPKIMFDDPKKKSFDKISHGSIILSSNV